MIPNLLTSTDSPHIKMISSLRKLIYFYQKTCLNSINEKRVPAEMSIILIEYLKKYYFGNSENLFLNNPSFLDSENLSNGLILDQIHAKTSFKELIDDETILILQALKICSNIITVLSYNAIDILFQMPDNNVVDSITLEKYFNEHYFSILIDFLLNKTLILSPSKLIEIKHHPENYFNEYFDGQGELDLRKNSVDLLKVFFLYVNPEKITKILENILTSCHSKILKENEEIFYIEILKREAFYFVIHGLFRELKNDINFEKWFEDQLKHELNLQNER